MPIRGIQPFRFVIRTRHIIRDGRRGRAQISSSRLPPLRLDSPYVFMVFYPSCYSYPRCISHEPIGAALDLIFLRSAQKNGNKSLHDGETKH